MPRRGFSAEVTVFTKPGTADADRRFFPLTPPRDSSQAAKVLAVLALYAITGDMLFQLGFQESDNPETWPDAITFTRIGTTSATAGPTYSNDAYEAITLTKPYVRFAVIVRNNTGNPPKIELCWVSGRFDARSC
jgi:hypothetical protein